MEDFISDEEDYRNLLSDESDSEQDEARVHPQVVCDAIVEDRFVRIEPVPELEYVSSNRGKPMLLYKVWSILFLHDFRIFFP